MVDCREEEEGHEEACCGAVGRIPVQLKVDSILFRHFDVTARGKKKEKEQTWC
jgi:hypothetical protein